MGGDGRPPTALRLQVAAMALAALLPVAWLIGRRTAPPPGPQPLLVKQDDEGITLQETHRGLAGGPEALRLPPGPGGGAAYRLKFLLGGAGEAPRSPFRLRLEGPRGDDLWQGTLEVREGERPAFDLLVPAALLRPGRHAVRVEDAGGIVRSYTFIVP